jgi:hypothetical protein
MRPLLLALLALPAIAQNKAASDALARFKQLRPGDADLAMYRLDWKESLPEALKVAAKEQRPILFVVIHAKYGDMISGHC